MQVEPYPEDEGYRVWLSTEEQQSLVNYFEEFSEERLAVELMLDGLRSEEVPRVAWQDFRKMTTEQEGWMLHVWESKTDYRECPVSVDTVEKAKALKNVQSLHQDEPIVDYHEGTVSRWVRNAAQEIAEDSEEEKHWQHVRAT